MVLSMMKLKFICTCMHRIAMKMYNLACIELNMEIKVLNLTCKLALLYSMRMNTICIVWDGNEIKISMHV